MTQPTSSSHAGCAHAPPAHSRATPAQAGERNTRQRMAIRQAMAAEGRPLSPPEVLKAARKLVPRIGIATVYRNIKAMVEAGELAAVPLPGERVYYELADKAEHHHHHFRCNQCEKVFDIHGCDDTFASLLPEGFVLTAHDVTLYGLCADCSAAARARPGKRR